MAVSEGLSNAEMKSGTPIALGFNPEHLYLFGADGKRIAGK